MPKITRPLLASSLEDLSTLKFPLLATQKLDGIRCLKIDGKVLTRKLKELPNRYIRSELEKTLPNGIDGEIMLQGDFTFNDIQSKVMSFEGEPPFVYCAFDYVKDSLETPYWDRIKDLKQWYDNLFMIEVFNGASRDTLDKLQTRIKILIPVTLENQEDVLGYERKCLEQGYEGIMLRHPFGRYKCGRSTPKEGILIKLKQFKDSEAIVLGFQEKLHNDNPQEINELGLSKRSSKKEGLLPAGILGALLVKDIETGQEFGIGSGLNDEQKKEIWENQHKYLGKMVTYKYQAIGIKELPRFPVFKGFRSELDR